MMRKITFLAAALAGGCSLAFALAWSGKDGPEPSTTTAPRIAISSRWKSGRPLIGANYTHYAVRHCSLQGTGILANYGADGVREEVQGELVAMRAAGLQALRLIVWHQSNVDRQSWGVVSSAQGRLSQSNRENLAAFATDVREAGFAHLFVSFAPMGSSDPKSPDYRSKEFRDNWHFVTDVRAVVKRYGPSSTQFDLMNEAPPSYWEPRSEARRVMGYIAHMYVRYARAFGTRDVTVSSIAGVGTRDAVSRIENLVTALRATGLSDPRWFEVHLGQRGSRAFGDLLAIDRALRARGLRQPLVIGETAYDDGVTARAIARFVRASSRPIRAILEWPLTRNRPCRDMSVSPPYRAEAYMNALWPTQGARR
jgi:hypothetical protein